MRPRVWECSVAVVPIVLAFGILLLSAAGPARGDAATMRLKRFRERQVERDRLQAHAVEAGLFRHHGELDRFLRLEPDAQDIRRRPRIISENVVGQCTKLDIDFGASFRHPLAGSQEKRNAGPSPILNFGMNCDKCFGPTGAAPSLFDIAGR